MSDTNETPTVNTEQQIQQLQAMVNTLQSDLVANAFTLRRDMVQQMFDPRRNIYHECGWPEPRRTISAQDYEDLCDRDPIAARLVGQMPQECWQTSPLIYEDEDPEVVTAFEQAWDELGSTIRGENSHFRQEEGSVIWEYLQRADELSRRGHYGIVLLGIDDGLDLSMPARGVEEKNSFPVEQEYGQEEVDSPLYDGLKSSQRVPKQGTAVNYRNGKPEMTVNGRTVVPPYKLVSNFLPEYYQGTSGAVYADQRIAPKEDGKKPGSKKNTLKYLRVFGEAQAAIASWESNPSSPRFGQPTSYLVNFSSSRDDAAGLGSPMSTRTVHWTRVVHIADVHHQKVSNECIAKPVLLPVLNNILDIQKMRGGSAEGYWKMGLPGFSWETHPNLGTFKVDADKTRAQFEEWQNSLQRLLVSVGGSFKSLAPNVTDPTPFINLQLEHIAIQSGTPLRILKGSERGELASSQDERAWRQRVRQRQSSYLIPRVIVPFVDRLILLGCLPAPAKKGSKLNVKELPKSEKELPLEQELEQDEKEEQFAQEEEIDLEPEREEKLEKSVGNAFPFKGGKQQFGQKGGFPPNGKESSAAAVGGNKFPFKPSSGKLKGLEGVEQEQKVHESLGGYCVEWPDIASQSDAEQADVCAKNTTSLTAYIQGQGSALVPELTYLTHPKFMGLDEEEAQQMVEEAARVQEEELAEQQLQADEFGYQPEPGEGFIDPEQADRELELGKAQTEVELEKAKGKMEVDKERVKAGLEPASFPVPP